MVNFGTIIFLSPRGLSWPKHQKQTSALEIHPSAGTDGGTALGPGGFGTVAAAVALATLVSVRPGRELAAPPPPEAGASSQNRGNKRNLGIDCYAEVGADADWLWLKPSNGFSSNQRDLHIWYLLNKLDRFLCCRVFAIYRERERDEHVEHTGCDVHAVPFVILSSGSGNCSVG